jgi:hypothetical protein
MPEAGKQAKMAARIAALLANAEDFAKQGNEEARQSYLDKATALQLQYVIDDAMVTGQRQPTKEEIGEEDFCAESNTPLIKAKRELVAALAGLYRGRAVMMGEWTVHKGTGAPKWDKRAKVRVYAHTSDLAFIRAMYTSLLLQMATEMSRDERWREDARGVAGWRTSYAHAYVAHVVHRLHAAKLRQEGEVRTATPGAVVSLRDRATAVSVYVDGQHAKLTKTRYKVENRNAEGLAAGRRAAERADIGTRTVTRGGYRVIEQ